MKKFLLSLAVSMTAVCGAFAQTVIKADQLNPTGSVTVDGFTVTFAKNNGTNAPIYHSATDAIRLYAKGSMKVAGEKITKVVVTLASDASYRYTTFTPSAGAFEAEQAAGDSVITWSGDVPSVTFTVGDKATMGTDGDEKAGQMRIASLTIYGEGGETPDEPNPDDPTGDGYATILAKQLNPAGSATVGGFTVSFAKNNGSTAPAYHTGTEAIRLYAKGSMTVVGNKITKIVVALAKDASYKYTTFTPSTGALQTEQAVGDTEITWVGDATTVTFTVGDKATMGSDGEESNGQMRIASLTIYGEGGQVGGDEPDPGTDPDVPTTGKGSEEDPYTIIEAIALNNNKSKGWVNGYIVGCMGFEDGKGNYFSAEGIVNSNIVIAATTADFGTSYIAVQLAAGKYRDELNIQDRPGNIGKEITICGTFDKYCGTNGLKEVTNYTIVGGIAPLPSGEEFATLTDFCDDQPDKFSTILGPVTVFYQSPDQKYTFITDGTSNLQIYGSLPAYKNGDQLTGIQGKYSYYNNNPQMLPNVESFGAATTGTPVQPTEVAPEDVEISAYVTVIAIEIREEDGKFFYGEGDSMYQVFNRFNISGLRAGIATITGIGAVYGTQKQIFPTELKYRDAAIEEISAAKAGTKVIYDLQGRRVSNPGRGLYIVNGHKVVL